MLRLQSQLKKHQFRRDKPSNAANECSSEPPSDNERESMDSCGLETIEKDRFCHRSQGTSDSMIRWSSLGVSANE